MATTQGEIARVTTKAGALASITDLSDGSVRGEPGIVVFVNLATGTIPKAAKMKSEWVRVRVTMRLTAEGKVALGGKVVGRFDGTTQRFVNYSTTTRETEDLFCSVAKEAVVTPDARRALAMEVGLMAKRIEDNIPKTQAIMAKLQAGEIPDVERWRIADPAAQAAITDLRHATKCPQATRADFPELWERLLAQHTQSRIAEAIARLSGDLESLASRTAALARIRVVLGQGVESDVAASALAVAEAERRIEEARAERSKAAELVEARRQEAEKRRKEALDAARRLHENAPAMLEALKRLAFAAATRDHIMGDPCSLLAAKDELQRAEKVATALVRKIEGIEA